MPDGLRKDNLQTYRDMRDFAKTAEPPAEDRAGKDQEGSAAPLFVIQQHAASSMHFDFRLEAEGVLKSWAVPKGPSTDPGVKRLAIQVEDHPLDYASFEGTIPEGQYGGGAVIVWDTGAYRNLSRDKQGHSLSLTEAIRQGRVTFELVGQKLQGTYKLVHTPMRGKQPQWLLIKSDDAHADRRRNPVTTETRSVLTDRTIEDVEKQHKEE